MGMCGDASCVVRTRAKKGEGALSNNTPTLTQVDGRRRLLQTRAAGGAARAGRVVQAALALVACFFCICVWCAHLEL